jgi:hypothetical protein
MPKSKGGIAAAALHNVPRVPASDRIGSSDRASEGVSSATAMTRRALVGATIAAPAFAHGGTARSSDALARSKAWLAMDAEIEQLTLAWGDEEVRLFRDFNWPRLSEAEQRAHPEGRLIHALGDRINALYDQRWEVLEALEKSPAGNLHDVAGKLAVVVRVMRHEDAIGFELLEQAVRELADQRCRTCGAALIPPDLLA